MGVGCGLPAWIGKAELVLGPFKVLLESGDLRSTGGSGQQQRLLIHIDIYC